MRFPFASLGIQPRILTRCLYLGTMRSQNSKQMGCGCKFYLSGWYPLTGLSSSCARKFYALRTKLADTKRYRLSLSSLHFGGASNVDIGETWTVTKPMRHYVGSLLRKCSSGRFIENR